MFGNIKDKIIIKRYVDAFLGYARETCGLQRAIEDFKNIKEVVRSNPEFMDFLRNPEMGIAEKEVFLDRVLERDFSAAFRQFLKLLLTKNRIDKLNDIAEYIRINFSRGNETEVLLRTSFPLDLELIQLIKEKIEKKIAGKLKLYIELDGSLLGGVQVVIGNTIMDGSVRRRIDELREKLQTIRIN